MFSEFQDHAITFIKLWYYPERNLLCVTCMWLAVPQSGSAVPHQNVYQIKTQFPVITWLLNFRLQCNPGEESEN